MADNLFAQQSPQGRTHAPRSKKKKLIYVAITLGVVAAAVAGFMLLGRLQSQKQQEKDVQQQKVEKQVVSLRAAANSVTNPNEYSRVADDYDTAVEGASTNDEKISLLLEKATLAIAQEKYDDAIAAAKQADAIAPSRPVSEMIAAAAEAKGDSTQAIAYIKKSIEQMDKGSPLYDSDLKDKQAKIRELGGTV